MLSAANVTMLNDLSTVVNVLFRHRRGRLRANDLSTVLTQIMDVEPIGMGHFGCIVPMGTDKVLKLCFRPEDGYRLFIQWVLSQPDVKHLPELLHVQEFGPVLAVVLPKYVEGVEGEYFCMAEQEQGVQDMVDRLRDDVSEYADLDVHGGNWMYRDSSRTEPVLIDGIGYMREKDPEAVAELMQGAEHLLDERYNGPCHATHVRLCEGLAHKREQCITKFRNALSEAAACINIGTNTLYHLAKEA